MKTYHKLFLIFGLLLNTVTAFSQTSNSPKALVDSGVVLFDKGSYNDAIEKYKAALSISPNDLRANFEMAYTLQTIGKSQDAIPFVETILKSPGGSKYEAYELLGTIYDDTHEPDKAIEAYKKGIEEKPDFSRLHLNLGITYMGIKKYSEAESEAIEAIKLDPMHASNHRLYAMATLNQNKKLCAVAGFCNFLLLEPQSKRSEFVYKYLDTLFKTEAANKTMVIKLDNGSKEISAMSMAELSVNLGGSAAKALKDQNSGEPADQLMIELKIVFNALAKGYDDVPTKDFFWNFYADYFGKLAKTDNMPAFVRYISLSAYRDQNLQWFKDHDKELKDFQNWVSSTERKF